MDSERVLISRPLPRSKLLLLRLTGFLALALGGGGFVVFLAKEAAISGWIAALPFGPKDSLAAVLPILGLPALSFLLLWERYRRLYGSCQLVPGALVVRPLFNPGDRGSALWSAAVCLPWSRVLALEERADTLRLELKAGGAAHVPTTDPELVRLLLRLHEEALLQPPPVHFSFRSNWATLAIQCARAVWLSLFGLLSAVLTLLGVVRYAPTLGSGSPAPQLLALLVFTPLFAWYCRVRLPRMLGIEHEFPTGLIELLPAGLRLGLDYAPYEGMRVYPTADSLAFELASGERYLVKVGRTLPEVMDALGPKVTILSERPDWVVTDQARAYVHATLFFVALVALQVLLLAL